MRPESEPTRVPVMLSLARRACVVVGGGPVALRRARRLCEAGASVGVIAPRIDAGFDGLDVVKTQREYTAGDLKAAFLVVVATDTPAVNDRVAHDAHAAGALVCRADRGDTGDLTFMAHERRGPLTVAADSGGASAAAARELAGVAAEAVGPHWPVLLAEARTRREGLRGQPEKLRRLTDAAALDILQRLGREALTKHLDGIAARG